MEFIAENGGSTKNMSKYKIMRLMEMLDFMVELSEEKRLEFRRKLKELSQSFEVDTKPFERVTE